MKTANTLKKKSVLLLFGLMLLAMSVLFFGKGINADAAGTKATLKDKTLTSEYGRAYCPITIKNWNPKAKYTVSVSPADSATVGYIYESSEDANNAEIGITVNKKGTIKVTVKETVNNTTRKVGVCTIKASTASEYSGVFLPPVTYNFQKGQTYNINDLLNSSSVESYKFSIADKSIATINKYGVITAKKAGKTTLTIKKGTDSASTDIEVVSSTFTAKESKKITQLKSKIEALYKKKITAGNYTSWYNEYYALSEEWKKYTDYSNFYFQVNGRYTLSDCCKKLADFMKTRTSNSAYGASLDAVKITKLTSNQVSLQLAKPVSRADMVNILRGSGKYSKNAKANYTIVLSRTDGKYNYTYTFIAPVKEGQKVITGKLKYAGKYTINPPYKNYTLKKAEKGKTYTYTLRFAGNSSMTYQKRTIKCS